MLMEKKIEEAKTLNELAYVRVMLWEIFEYASDEEMFALNSAAHRAMEHVDEVAKERFGYAPFGLEWDRIAKK